MNEWSLLTKFILAAALGALIGAERETTFHQRSADPSVVEKIGGLRTYALISLMGAVTAIIGQNQASFSYLVLAGFMVLVALSYVSHAFLNRTWGITTEISSIFAFILGFLTITEVIPLKIVVATSVLVVLLLSQKKELEEVVEGFQHQEILNLISFAIVALVVLPFLPNQSYQLFDLPMVKDFCISLNLPVERLSSLEVINPFRTWLIVVLVSGANLFSHYLSKFWGSQKSEFAAAATGGMVSSTLHTQFLVSQSSKDPSLAKSHALAGSALVSNASCYLLILFLTLPISLSFFRLAFLPIVSSALLTAALGAYLIKKSTQELKKSHALAPSILEPFSLKPAIRFAFLLVIIKIVAGFFLSFYGNSAFYLSVLASSYASVNATALNVAELAGGQISLSFALITLLGIFAINLLGKLCYSLVRGQKDFTKWLALGYSLALGSAALVSILSL